MFFLDFLCNFRQTSLRQILFAVLKQSRNELGHFSSCQRNVLDAATDNVAIAHGEHVGNTVAGVNDSASHVVGGHLQVPSFLFSAADLRVEGQRCLHSDVEAMHIERLEHDFGHLFPGFWRVHWRLSQNKSVLFGLAPQILVH